MRTKATTETDPYSIGRGSKGCNVFFMKEGHIWKLLTQADLSTCPSFCYTPPNLLTGDPQKIRVILYALLVVSYCPGL